MVRGIRVSATALLLAAFVLTSVPLGLAADPPSAPRDLKAIGFENESTDNLSPIQPIVLQSEPYTSAYWKPITGRNQTGTPGSYGLWCAGAAYPGGGARSYGAYPDYTRGRAYLNMPELANYYRSWIRFGYVYPSRGAADTNAFRFSWQYGGGSTGDLHGFPLSSSWTNASFELSAGEDVVLSRDAGLALWNFYDLVEASNQTPRIGYGPTVDNVVLSAYKYAAPRSLVATRVAGGVKLTWADPQYAVDDSSADTRAKSYRVWRTIDGGFPSWVELTSSASRLTSKEMTDTTGLIAGQTYRYAVQAWDTGTGPDYGPSAQATVRMRRAGLDVEAAAPVTVRAGESFVTTYAVADTSGDPRGPISVTDNLGYSGQVGPLAGGGSASLTVSRALTEDATITVTAHDADAGETATDTRAVDVRDPELSLEMTSAADSLYPGQTTAVTYTVRNSGDTALSNVEVTDGLGGALVAQTASLAPGEVYEFAVQRGPGIVTGFVSGDYGVEGTPFSGTVSTSQDTDIVELVPHATAVSLVSSPAVPTLGSTGVYIKLTARATDAGTGLPAPSSVIRLQHYSGGWKTVATATGSSATFSRKITRTTSFRVIYDGVPSHTAVTGAGVSVVPYAYLSRPNKPRTVYRNRSFSAWGYLGPKHSGKVKVVAERRENGKWVARATGYATLSSKSSYYNRYSASVKIRYAGYYRLRAYHAGDTLHRSTWSSPTTTFRVR